MPNWTKEQELAIVKDGMNIIVSAGAGSGKTAVLTERVIRKLQNGEDIDHLLILTFTNLAAREMRERIRKAIKKANLTDQLAKLDSSYITTFDSFALKIVKKYHYLLNLDKDIQIGDSLIIKWEKEKILDKIFDNYYEKKDSLFLKLIKDFTIRDDNNIKSSILNIYNKLDLMYDKKNYLSNYINNYFNNDYIDQMIEKYVNFIRKKQQDIIFLLKEIELRVDSEFFNNFSLSINSLINANTYIEFKNSVNEIKLTRLKNGMSDCKEFKEKITSNIKDIKKLVKYDSVDEIKKSIYDTKDYTKIIIDILLNLDNQINIYKEKNNIYDFIDISKLAIKIVLNYEREREELKYFFHEILIDEYQDTSDLQELFINAISNNNVYMVGDIKQSIYRFRNANPNLFKEKYEQYSNLNGGFKIDLVKNFRSRKETLDNINYVFNYIMDIDVGGADYKKLHQMQFGNNNYLEYGKTNQEYNFEIYNYNYESKEYSKDEIEAFIIAKDIKDKINNKYLVFDKDTNILREITYNDCVILIDKSISFDLYKNIFEYFYIPLTILKDESISGSSDLYLIKNIFTLINKIKTNTFDKAFKYAYLSIGRSYLFQKTDDYLYHLLTENTYFNDSIYLHIKNLLNDIDIIPINVLIDNIIEEFSFYEKLITVGNVYESIIRLDYIRELSKTLSNLSYTYLNILEYFNKIIDNKEDIKYSLNKDNQNSVKIMTIHKSKGLEYHICYYSGLTNRFNLDETKKRFIYDSNYGIIIPSYKEGIDNTIYHTLYKENYIKEDISERIRLFYVALTRAKEKMILITSLNDTLQEDDEVVSLNTRLKYQSFAMILNSIKDKLNNYIKEIDLNNYNLTKEYTISSNKDIKSLLSKNDNTLNVSELNIKSNEILNKHFSKENRQIIDINIKNKLETGIYIHEILETIDLKNPDFTIINNNYLEYIKKFFQCDLLKNIKNGNYFQEYEFMYLKENVLEHGIIDLLVEYDTYLDIIDYKLKNIDDDNYINQLKGYREYIMLKTNKKVNIYLYSILDGVYKEII